MSGLYLEDLPKDVLLEIIQLMPHEDIVTAIKLNKGLLNKLVNPGRQIYNNRRLEYFYGITEEDMLNSETLYNKLEGSYNVLLRRRLLLRDLKST